MQPDLSDLLSRGEGQTTEFKQSLSLRDEGLEALCGMVNSDAAEGTVLFGIAPNGGVVGVEDGNLDTAQRSLSQAIRSNFDPPLTPEIWVEAINGESVVGVKANRSPTVPYHEYKGRAYIRQGSETRLLTHAQKDGLRRNRDRAHHMGPWKCDRCGSLVGQLFSFKVTDEGMERTYECECGGQFQPVA